LDCSTWLVGMPTIPNGSPPDSLPSSSTATE
jgi:hypothetical protein